MWDVSFFHTCMSLETNIKDTKSHRTALSPVHSTPYFLYFVSTPDWPGKADRRLRKGRCRFTLEDEVHRVHLSVLCRPQSAPCTIKWSLRPWEDGLLAFTLLSELEDPTQGGEIGARRGLTRMEIRNEGGGARCNEGTRNIPVQRVVEWG